MRSAARVNCAVLAAVLLALSTILLSSANSGAAAQAGASLPAASSVAKPHAFVSVDEAPAGHSFEVAVVVDILNGYHMNSHKPTEDYLIPTSLNFGSVAGIRELETNYPDGQMLKFDFSQEKLSVYSGSVTIRAKLAVDSGAAPREITLPFTLRYQACNMSACLPPTKVSVPVKLKIAAADVKPHALHPEIFKSQSK